MSISSVATGLFSSWSAKADLEDTHNVAIDRETIATLQKHAPEMAASRYVEDDLPEWVERLLDQATAAAGARDDAFIDRYRIALTTVLAR